MDMNGSTILLDYADDIVLLEVIENEVISTEERLIDSSCKIGHIFNESKTKYLVMIRRVINKTTIN